MARETDAARRRRALRIVRRLAAAYPDARCALDFRNPFELLVATILSAQCTDKKVNEVTPALFARYPTPEALAAAPPADVEAMIRPTGFYRQKTRALQATSRELAARFGGRVPGTMEELLTLHGVARKTANVVLGNSFGVPGLTVDTHMRRVNGRLGLTAHEDPVKIERDLMALVPEREWTMYSHRVIHHGRVCCVAQRPRCEECPLAADCPWPRARAGVRPAAAKRPVPATAAKRPAPATAAKRPAPATGAKRPVPGPAAARPARTSTPRGRDRGAR